jgi:putative ABC transport system permease protein
MDNEFRNMPGVKTVGTANNYPGSPGINLNLFTVQTNTGHTDKGIECYGIDENYLGALGIPVVRGRNFSNPADTLHSIIVNESMVKHFEWDNPIGKRVTFPEDTSGRYLEVVGVIKDFNQKSLYNKIAPLLLFYNPNSNIIQVKLNPGDFKASIAQSEKSEEIFSAAAL